MTDIWPEVLAFLAAENLFACQSACRRWNCSIHWLRPALAAFHLQTTVRIYMARRRDDVHVRRPRHIPEVIGLIFEASFENFTKGLPFVNSRRFRFEPDTTSCAISETIRAHLRNCVVDKFYLFEPEYFEYATQLLNGLVNCQIQHLHLWLMASLLRQLFH